MSSNSTVKAKPRASVHALGRNIVTVASGKGGVGKTWFAISLAQALSKAGKRVLLFDGDLGLANVDVQLGVMPDRDLATVVGGKITLFEAIMPVKSTGFDLIGGRSGSGALARLNQGALEELQRNLIGVGQHYDQIILDLGAGVDTGVTTLARHNGVILVVVTDEPTALTDAYAFIKLMIAKNPRADIRIVVNVAQNKKQGERTYETLKRACEGFLRITPKLAGIIRRDPKVPDAIRHQAPLLTRHPVCNAASDVEAIAKTLRA
jgi:flagellar biosynthesis protein FlhG